MMGKSNSLLSVFIVNNLAQLLPLLDKNDNTIKSAGKNPFVAYLGDENGIDLGIVFEILQNLHTLALRGWPIDIWPERMKSASFFLKKKKQVKCRAFQTLYTCHKKVAVLVKTNSIFLEGKHIVGKDNDFVVAPFMEANEKLAGSKFVRVHCVHKDALLGLDGHILSVKLW